METATKPKKIISGLLLLLILLNFNRKANAECSKEDTNYYSCREGSVADLEKVPDDVTLLEIESMPMESLTPKIMSRFSNLKYLSIIKSSISFIENNTFSNNTQLKQIILKEIHSFTKLQTNAFLGLDSLNVLNIIDAGINCIEQDFFNKTLPNLEKLILMQTDLVCFNFNALDNQKNLTKIFMPMNEDFKCRNAVKKYANDRKIEIVANDGTEDTTGPDSPCPKILNEWRLIKKNEKFFKIKFSRPTNSSRKIEVNIVTG